MQFPFGRLRLGAERGKRALDVIFPRECGENAVGIVLRLFPVDDADRRQKLDEFSFEFLFARKAVVHRDARALVSVKARHLVELGNGGELGGVIHGRIDGKDGVLAHENVIRHRRKGGGHAHRNALDYADMRHGLGDFRRHGEQLRIRFHHRGALAQTRAGAIEDGDERSSRLAGSLHAFDDFLGRRRADTSQHHVRVLGKYVDGSAFDRGITRNDALARYALTFRADHESVRFHERAFVHDAADKIPRLFADFVNGSLSRHKLLFVHYKNLRKFSS